MQLLNEFKAFILRGNVVDLAVGLIIGTAFTGIVNSLVNDILMPPIGAMTQGVKFDDLAVKLPFNVPTPETKDKPPAEQVLVPAKVTYGKFIQAVINFLIVGVCMFFLIKGMNTLMRKKKEEPKPAELTTTEKLLTEIRDNLQKRS